jgi:hypothetical protein
VKNIVVKGLDKSSPYNYDTVSFRNRVERESNCNPPLRRGDFHYRLCARFDLATGGDEKNFRAATAD